ncbi:MAG TPA: hypothetical protein VFV07_08530 [Rhizomicrobium sp.]|nr:hypothetical protein [Rhizomicrobium sp.]
MIDVRILQRALLVGTALQVAMVLLSHFSPWVREHVLLFGAMMISATAGYLYAMDYGAGFGRGMLGGAIAGGVCGAIGVAATVLLKDAPVEIIALWTAIFAVTGIAGGFWGQVAARMTR